VGGWAGPCGDAATMAKHSTSVVGLAGNVSGRLLESSITTLVGLAT
jgi:hypothetical protein